MDSLNLGTSCVSSFKSGRKIYILTGDMKWVLKAFCDKNRWNVNETELYEISEKFQAQTISMLQYSLQDKLIKFYSEAEIEEYILKESAKLLSKNYKLVCLDRYISQFLSDQNIPKNSLSITRSTCGTKIPRIGDLPLQNQFKVLGRKLRGEKVAIVDDGVFSGGTLAEISSKLGEYEVEIACFLGYISKQLPSVSRIEIITAHQFSSDTLYDWSDMRDLSIFGGKLIKNSNHSVPYFPPFWNNFEWRTSPPSYEIDFIHKQILANNIQLINNLENLVGQKIKFEHFLTGGFSLPTSFDFITQSSLNQSVTEFLGYCTTIL